jgi:integrase
MLEDLTKGFFADYTAERMKAGRCGATVNRDLNTMRSFWSYLEEWTPLQPTRFTFRLAKESRGRERWLDASEIEAARTVCSSKWWLLFSMLIQTGMRIGEAQGLRWSDIRFDEDYIELHDQYRRLKTATSHRHVLLPHDLKMLLHAEATSRPSIGPALVFADTRGNRRNALHVWQRVVKKAGLEHASLHDLRHTFGVHAARSGIPLARLQKLMGHATTAMTLKYLAHSPENHLGNDAALLSASIRGERISPTQTPTPALSLVKDA